MEEANRDPYEGVPEWKKGILRKNDERKAIEREHEKIREENMMKLSAAPQWKQALIRNKMFTHQPSEMNGQDGGYSDYTSNGFTNQGNYSQQNTGNSSLNSSTSSFTSGSYSLYN